MESSRAKTNRVFPRKCTGHNKHPLPTAQKTTHGHHQMVNTEIRLIIFFAAKDGEAKTRPEADYDSDHEVLIANSDLN